MTLYVVVRVTDEGDVFADAVVPGDPEQEIKESLVDTICCFGDYDIDYLYTLSVKELREELIALRSNAEVFSQPVPLVGAELQRYIIVKKTRGWRPGKGYFGPTCESAGTEPGKIYDTLEEARRDAKIMDEYNPVGFEVVPYMSEEDYLGKTS